MKVRQEDDLPDVPSLTQYIVLRLLQLSGLRFQTEGGLNPSGGRVELRADFLLTCDCGWHGVVIEVRGGLGTIPGYTKRWLQTTGPWYVRWSHRYLLVCVDLESALDVSELTVLLDALRELLEPDSSLLHEVLRDGRSRRMAEQYLARVERIWSGEEQAA